MFKKKFAQGMAITATAASAQLFVAAAQADQAELEAYGNSGYGWCDAKKVAAVWEQDIVEAKAIIGGKILSNLTHLIDADIASTGADVPCLWGEDIDLEYEDAEKLAAFWGTEVHEAKDQIQALVTDLGMKHFNELMAGALGRS